MARIATLIPAPLIPAARALKAWLAPAPQAQLNEVLLPEQCSSVLAPKVAVLTVEQNQRFTVPVQITNQSPVTLSPLGTHGISVRARWLNNRKEPLGETVETTISLPQTLQPGEGMVVAPQLIAPAFLGSFLVEVDLIQTKGTSFANAGNRPALVDARVTGRVEDDIDYHKVYATADLNVDYWTVVGPSTKAEYDRLGPVKLGLLKDLGLNPDSRLLDVGCGTGQVTVAMESFLSDKGAYFGTDVGPEAITYCQQRFTRPNFQFALNGMTTIPAPPLSFDMACFFSVFTHTYPDETVLLLHETKRALVPGGIIFADVFTSPLVDRTTGNRGAIELNREHFLRLVEVAGFKHELVMKGDWQRHACREFFKLTKPT